MGSKGNFPIPAVKDGATRRSPLDCGKRAKIMPMTFTGDEVILALVSLVRATRPGMLRQEADGFSVDFEAIALSKTPGKADQLLLKMGSVMGSTTAYPAENPSSSISLDLDAGEARQIADALAKL